MPFGLVAAPSEVCRIMGDIFRNIQWVECLLYMDDIIVPAKTVEKNIIKARICILKTSVCKPQIGALKMNLLSKVCKIPRP